MPENVIMSFKKYIHDIKEKVSKCDNNMPYLAADLMETIQDNVASKSLSPHEGFEIRRELYEALKNVRKCGCK